MSFQTLIIFLMNMLKGSVQDELDHFFKTTNKLLIPFRFVTKSAFTQARKKLCSSAFVELNFTLADFFYKHFPVKTWHGFRLLAIDGSSLRLPNNKHTKAHFGQWRPRKGGPCVLARVSQLYDVLNHITLDASLAPKSVGERRLAAEHLLSQDLGGKDLILFDMGYPAYWLFALMLKRGIQFCTRMSTSHWVQVEEFCLARKSQAIIEVEPPNYPRGRKLCKNLGLNLKPIKLRLIKVFLDNGDTEVLITSLTGEKLFPSHLFKQLYGLRWPVEENYKTLKCRVQIEEFSGKTVQAIEQDFHAKVLSTNLVTAMTHPVQAWLLIQNQAKLYDYKVNFTQALSKMKDTIVLLFKQDKPRAIIDDVLNLFLKTTEPIRSNRKYPRKKGIKLQIPAMAYKQIR